MHYFRVVSNLQCNIKKGIKAAGPKEMTNAKSSHKETRKTADDSRDRTWIICKLSSEIVKCWEWRKKERKNG